MLKLMYITNDKDIAQIAQSSGVDRIFIDLEQLGKSERQGGMDTVQSRHTLSDIQTIRPVLDRAEILVRINPIHPGSQAEIDQAIEFGADILMLPYFKTVGEVEAFVNMVDHRVKTCLLVETPQAVEHIDEILDLGGFDEIHIGLNDLHLGYKMKFMFQLLADHTVDCLCEKFEKRNIFYGFGGIAQLGKGAIPAEKIIAEHYRLHSGMAILSRSFCNVEHTKNHGEVKAVFDQGVAEIRRYEETLANCSKEWFTNNHQDVCGLVEAVVEGM